MGLLSPVLSLVSIGQGIFSRLTPEKWSLPLEAYIAHTTSLRSADALQCDEEDHQQAQLYAELFAG
jgi:hypothetical protein